MTTARTRPAVRFRSLLAVAWLGVLAGCGGDPDAPPTPIDLPEPVTPWLDEDGTPLADALADEQELHRGNGEEPQTLDPHRADGVPTANILRDLFEGLTTTAPDGRIVPGAAGRWDISRDGMTYTFYLRDDGRWSNGDPLTAEDFVFSFRRSVDPETAAAYGRMLAPIMPYRFFAELTDEDASAIARYLQSLPPLENAVPEPVGPDGKATAPYLKMVVPPAPSPAG